MKGLIKDLAFVAAIMLIVGASVMTGAAIIEGRI